MGGGGRRGGGHSHGGRGGHFGWEPGGVDVRKNSATEVVARGEHVCAVDGPDRLRPLLDGVECQDDMSGAFCIIGAMGDSDSLLRGQDVMVGATKGNCGCLGREARDKAAVRREGIGRGGRVGEVEVSVSGRHGG